nr:PfkB family carbohydrate kinase [Conservatibacter flavescens]
MAHIAYLPLLPALLQQDILTSALHRLKESGFSISIDLVSVQDSAIFQEQIRPILPYIDFVIINDVEACILANKNTRNLTDLAKIIYQLGVKNTVIIHSPQQAVAYNAQEIVVVPSYWVDKRNILSTLGAGDAFCAGVLYGLHNNMPLEETLKLGHGLAYFNLFSLSATDGAVSYSELQHFIQSQV